MNKEHIQSVFSSDYDQYIQSIYRFAYIKVNSQYTAEEICSNVFTKYWQELCKGSKIENPRAFLYKLARNAVIDFYRKRSREATAPIEAGLELETTPSFVPIIEISSDLEQIKSAMCNLDQEAQNAVIWHFLDDMPTKEIAKILGKSDGSVRTMISRSLKDIRSKLV